MKNAYAALIVSVKVCNFPRKSSSEPSTAVESNKEECMIICLSATSSLLHWNEREGNIFIAAIQSFIWKNFPGKWLRAILSLWW